MYRGVQDKTLDDVQKGLDSGNPHVAGFAIPDVNIHVHAEVVREKQTARNVVGYLPATDRNADKPWVVVGAHYDHLGRGDRGSSLAPKEEIGRVHFGADDNASGAAAVLAAGEVLANESRRRNVLLAFWSGEELGLVGSSAFIASPPVRIDQIAAYLNFDMVGRMQDNKLTVQAMGTSSAWAKVIERAN